MSAGCDLCRIQDCETTEFFKIVVCNTCNIPMLVLKRHNTKLTFEETRELVDMWEIKFRGKHLRTQARKILDHWHGHMEAG